ncbi:MAG: hypothetical protein MUE44_19280 [Oscillatoriaceae cyanobacterium Prado104]|nr:hypothetical protein [Oscillatoriaceae cyanobacterium Prado104]
MGDRSRSNYGRSYFLKLRTIALFKLGAIVLFEIAGDRTCLNYGRSYFLKLRTIVLF